MNWKRNPMLQDRLAAEYVLGTLRGPARARFARWMREDAALRTKVAEWDSRILPMSAAVPDRPAPARVWEAVASRTGAHTRPAARGLWDSLGFWRGLGLAASGMAAALLVITVVVPPRQADAPPPALVRMPSGQLGAAYVAVLSDAKTQKPVLLASAARDSRQLFVKVLDQSIHVDGSSLELWALPTGKAPRSLGVLGADDKLKLALHAPADESLGDVPALAVSLEPKGGSPTGAPSGPVLFSGPCVRHW